jgi:hypothetical protein
MAVKNELSMLEVAGIGKYSPFQILGAHMSDLVNVQLAVDDARRAVTITMVQNGRPLAHAIVEAAEMKELIHAFAQAGYELADRVPLTVDHGTKLAALVDPGWHFPGDVHPEGKVLALRHPGFGWLSFLFPYAEARAIAQMLLANNPAN